MAAKCATKPKKMAKGGMNGGRKNNSQLDPEFMNMGEIKRNGPSKKLAAAKRDADEKETTRQLNLAQLSKNDQTADANGPSGLPGLYAKGGLAKKKAAKGKKK